MLSIFAVLSTLAWGTSGCGAGLSSQRELRTEAGSCEVTCDHYEHCKGTRDAARESSCLAECRSIFSEDGRTDGDSLRGLEELSCRQLLSFIEGSGSRPPGSPEN